MNDSALLARIDERTQAMERRLARVEIGMLSAIGGAAYIAVQYILKVVGLA
ncbi:hypothetical protein [Sneathiella glossodoripedis]|uniref:hypothetical protein n=1 Tax=Sneathiella glossodoripedis TaxID=418853 RepID=UPI00131F21F5|nr:hypothetical protein [Sneathiella glossodoripedis]